MELSYSMLINTGPIDQLIKHTKLCPELDLKYNKVRVEWVVESIIVTFERINWSIVPVFFQVFVIGIGLRKPMNHIAQRFTWLYFPEETVPFYRITFLSRYGEMTPNNDEYWSVLCECSRDSNDNHVRI